MHARIHAGVIISITDTRITWQQSACVCTQTQHFWLRAEFSRTNVNTHPTWETKESERYGKAHWPSTRIFMPCFTCAFVEESTQKKNTDRCACVHKKRGRGKESARKAVMAWLHGDFLSRDMYMYHIPSNPFPNEGANEPQDYHRNDKVESKWGKDNLPWSFVFALELQCIRHVEVNIFWPSCFQRFTGCSIPGGKTNQSQQFSIGFYGTVKRLNMLFPKHFFGTEPSWQPVKREGETSNVTAAPVCWPHCNVQVE